MGSNRQQIKDFGRRSTNVVALTPGNLRYIWATYQYRSYSNGEIRRWLSPKGVDVLFNLMISRRYNFFGQPAEIQGRIEEMMSGSDYGKRILNDFYEDVIERQ